MLSMENKRLYSENQADLCEGGVDLSVEIVRNL